MNSFLQETEKTQSTAADLNKDRFSVLRPELYGHSDVVHCDSHGCTFEPVELGNVSSMGVCDGSVILETKEMTSA